MKKSDKRTHKGGFTLIEVIVSTALLAVVCTGFLMMTAANVGQLSREYRLERSNYDLSSRAGDGRGDPTGETISVEFSLEGGTSETYTADRVREIFEQYKIRETREAAEDTESDTDTWEDTESDTGTWEDTGNFMTFYRFR